MDMKTHVSGGEILIHIIPCIASFFSSLYKTVTPSLSNSQVNHVDADFGCRRVFKRMGLNPGHGPRIGLVSTRGNGSQMGGLSDRRSSLRGLLQPTNSSKKSILYKKSTLPRLSSYKILNSFCVICKGYQYLVLPSRTLLRGKITKSTTMTTLMISSATHTIQWLLTCTRLSTYNSGISKPHRGFQEWKREKMKSRTLSHPSWAQALSYRVLFIVPTLQSIERLMIAFCKKYYGDHSYLAHFPQQGV